MRVFEACAFGVVDPGIGFGSWFTEGSLSVGIEAGLPAKSFLKSDSIINLFSSI